MARRQPRPFPVRHHTIGQTLNLQSHPACPPGYHWVETQAGPIAGMGDPQYVCRHVVERIGAVQPLVPGSERGSRWVGNDYPERSWTGFTGLRGTRDTSTGRRLAACVANPPPPRPPPAPAAPVLRPPPAPTPVLRTAPAPAPVATTPAPAVRVQAARMPITTTAPAPTAPAAPAAVVLTTPAAPSCDCWPWWWMLVAVGAGAAAGFAFSGKEGEKRLAR